MKILITGTTGFLGSHLIDSLKSQHSVVGLKRKTSDCTIISKFGKGFTTFDIEHGIDSLLEEHDNFDLIIHTATNYGHQEGALSELMKTNVVLPLELLEKSQEKKSCAFLNTDTFFCKMDEYTYLADYVFTKKLFFQLGSKFAETRKKSFINIRLEHMYGPGDGRFKFTMSLIRNLINNVPEIKFTEGEQQRDFIYIDDVVHAYECIINEQKLLEAQGPILFELGSGCTYSIKDFVTIAHKLTGSKSRLLFGDIPYREKEMMFSKAELSAIESLGWSSKVSIEDGIKNIISSLK